MLGLKILMIYLFTLLFSVASAQVKVRLFADKSPESAVFSVTEGKYEVNFFNGDNFTLDKGEGLIITKYNGRLAVKTRTRAGFICDSLVVEGKTGRDLFYLQINGDMTIRQYYSGDLYCFHDLETLLFINLCEIEQYISGVTRAEGGPGKNMEYSKTQALIARTYMYKYFNKHLSDRYNVCDNTHCQAFNGLTDDSIINKAVSDTRDMVILAPDSTLIISAFHSNCGGETSSSEDVWLTDMPYLKSVIDPYCLSSRNARWEVTISLSDWLGLLKRSGYEGDHADSDVFLFTQNTRKTDYTTGSFTVPLKTIRTEMNLRSTFFGVFPKGDSLVLKGKGYGHGVGLCQEGAMEMASKGFDYKQIIDFYYSGVIISDIKNAVIENDKSLRTLQ